MSLSSLRAAMVRWVRFLRAALSAWGGRRSPVQPPSDGVRAPARSAGLVAPDRAALVLAPSVAPSGAVVPPRVAALSSRSPVPFVKRLVRGLRALLGRPSPSSRGEMPALPAARRPVCLAMAAPPPPPRPARHAPVARLAGPVADPVRAAIDEVFERHGQDMPALLAGLRAFLAAQDFERQPELLARVADAVVRDACPLREGPVLFAFSALVEFFARDADLAPATRLALLRAIARCRPELAWSLMFELCAQLGGEAMREGTRGALHGFLMDPSHAMASATRAHMLDAFVKRAPMAIEDVAP